MNGRVAYNELKGIQGLDPFYSMVEASNTSYGMDLAVTAFASNSKLAHRAALLFVGHMLDVLSMKNQIPLYVSLIHNARRPNDKKETVCRILEKQNFKEAFAIARAVKGAWPDFLRGLGWFRKGLYAEDPFDKYFAYWNSIEVVCSKYHPRIPSHRAKGTKSQIWESFKSIWGDVAAWPGTCEHGWIDTSYEIRNKIAHGTAAVNIESVSEIVEKIPQIEQIAGDFLNQWFELRIVNELDLEYPF